MTRTQHYAHPTKSFPVYCLDWTDDDTVLLGGGGGATKSGIANKFVSITAVPAAAAGRGRRRVAAPQT